MKYYVIFVKILEILIEQNFCTQHYYKLYVYVNPDGEIH